MKMKIALFLSCLALSVSAQTKVNLSVESGTGRLVAPTNFFAGNIDWLTNALNAAGYAPGGDSTNDLNDVMIASNAVLQAQIDLKQPLDSDLTSIAALTTTSFGRGLLDDADASAGRTSLGVAPMCRRSMQTFLPSQY